MDSRVLIETMSCMNDLVSITVLNEVRNKRTCFCDIEIRLCINIRKVLFDKRKSCRWRGSQVSVYSQTKTYLYRIIHEMEIQVGNGGRCKNDSGRGGERRVWQEGEEAAHRRRYDKQGAGCAAQHQATVSKPDLYGQALRHQVPQKDHGDTGYRCSLGGIALKAYVTLEEAAQLENIGYHTFRQRVLRDTTGKFMTKTEKSESGGKDKVFVAVDSLSAKARKAYEQLQELQAQTDMPDITPKIDTKKPWYIGVSLDWYIENYPEQYYKGVELGNAVRNFLEYRGKQRTQYAADCAQNYIGKDQRTLYRHAKDYINAGAWAAKKAKEDGGNYDHYRILCLCRKPKPLNQHPSFKPEVEQLIRNIWFNKDFAANRGTKMMLYDKLQEVAKLNGWAKIPSYQSVTRYINWLMEDEAQYNAWYLASHGLREYKNKRMVKGVRDTTKLQVMEIVQGDEHTFDCWVAYTHPNGKVTAIRPKLVAWIDTRSRAILGDLMCKDANSEILKDSLLRANCSQWTNFLKSGHGGWRINT